MDLIEHMFQQVLGTPESTREAIKELQSLMQASPDKMSLDAWPVRHVFAPGVYVREMTLPEGTVIVGKIHRHAHVNIISVGRVRVLTEDAVQEFIAPYTFVSSPGTKRVVYALENTIWSTVHVTNETDLDRIEQEVIAEEYSDIELAAEYRRET